MGEKNIVTVIIYVVISILPVYSLKASLPVDTLKQQNKYVQKSIYPSDMKDKSRIYNLLWGKHYRDIYSVPITIPSTTFDIFKGGAKVTAQADNFHGLLLEDKQKKLYLLKPLGGSTSFLESDFFQEMYNKKDFQDTYLDTFIGDAYTIINPYTFIASDYIAGQIGLSSNNPRIYYLPPYTTTDTIADGSHIQDKLVSITDIPDFNLKENIFTTAELLEMMQKDKFLFVNQQLYIRERLFDMLIGDWNKIPENWTWNAQINGDSIVFNPTVVDRNHAFTKVDGLLFKEMLAVLGLGFISNYDTGIKKLKKSNKLGYTLDRVVTAGCDETIWIQEANYLKKHLSDSLINEAFDKLPKGVECNEIIETKDILKARRNQVEELAKTYYNILQYNPIITGTLRADSFIIDRNNQDNTHIRIYDKERGSIVFDKKYNKKAAKEIWIYGLGGEDHFEVNGINSSKILLISGKEKNIYHLDSKNKVKIFTYPTAKETFDSIPGVNVIFSDNEKIMDYDYTKTKYKDISFSPWGFYDSDLGMNLGSFVTFSMYSYKRFPFTYQHRIGFNYLKGFMYRGVFPLYNEKMDISIDSHFGFPKNYYNFFGFGNNTNGYKDEKKNYNRVNIRNFIVNPSFNWDINNKNKLSFLSSLEMIKVTRSSDKFINEVYTDDNRVFNTNYFADLGITYLVSKIPSSIISRLEGSLTAGWKVNLKEFKRNFPYASASVSLDLQLTDRFTLATMANAKTLFTDNYEFYQAATTELRGFRNNRFLGKQSFYQYSDFRVDMGELKNPFTPLKYGLFTGIDYGRVWLPHEKSKKWHTSYGGGIWLTIINKFTTKYSIFGSKDSVRFSFELGMGF